MVQIVLADVKDLLGERAATTAANVFNKTHGYPALRVELVVVRW